MRAVDDVTLRVGAGEIVGLSGPAAAGKSTLVAMILGYDRPTSGSVRLDGDEPRRFVEREGIGYLPQGAPVPGRWRVHDALARLAMLSGVAAADTRRRVEAVMEELALTPDRDTRVKSLGRDARQRLGIAQAIIAERRVVVLDEPLDGLEPLSVDRFQDLVIRLRGSDRAVLIVSRDTAELMRVADRVTLIDRGRVRRVGSPRTPTPADVATVFNITLHRGAEHVLTVFPSAISLGRSAFAVRVSGLGPLNLGLRELLERGALISAVTPAHSPAEPHALAIDEAVS